IVQRTGVGEGIKQIKAVASTMLELRLQRVVGEEAGWEGFLDGGEGRDRPALCDWQGTANHIRCRLVQVREHLQLDAMLTDVGDVKRRGRPKLLLHGEVIALHIAGGQVCRNVASLCVEVSRVQVCRESGNAGEPRGVAL